MRDGRRRVPSTSKRWLSGLMPWGGFEMKLHRCNVVALLFLLLLAASAPPIEAQRVTVVASGLDGPRGLKFGPDGALYVAEAGRGGPNASSGCVQVPSPVGPYHGGASA